MNQFYKILGTTKQAVHQEHARQVAFELELNELILMMDLLRTEHPGCGLEKAYDTLQPSLFGRDRFVETFMALGYRVRFSKNYTKTTVPGLYRCQNLIEGMIVDKVNKVVQSDITYIFVNGLYYYAIFILDVFSKRITAYEVSDNMRAQANIKALKQLIKLRSKAEMKGLIHHSDRGSQYGSTKYLSLLRNMGCYVSMADSAQKNAYAERINGIIKNEYLAYWSIPDLSTLKRKMKQAVNHYNHQRIHRSLPSNLSPVSFEQQWLKCPILQQHKELIYSPNNFVRKADKKHFFKTIESTNLAFCPLVIQ